MTTTKAILIPGDSPPSESSLKRQLLFFDSLLVPTPDDEAVLNKNEVSEAFPNGQVFRWGPIAPYPRSGSYDDQYRYLQAQAEQATRSGKLTFVQVRARSSLDATQNFVAALAALKTESLCRAALPDFRSDLPGVPMASRAGANMVIVSAAGYESQFHWLTQLDSKPAITLPEEWRAVALGRLGRALKIVRRASANNAIPLATDPTNRDICLALGAQAYGDLPNPRDLAAAAVALDTVDPVALDAALSTMSWAEVLRVRREVLPAVAKLRGVLQASVKAAARPQNAGLEPYLTALGKIRSDYQSAGEEAGKAWTQIGIRLAETGVSTAAGLTVVAPSITWAAALASGATALVAQAITGLGTDIKSIWRGGVQKASPLFAFDGLISRGEQVLAKDAKAE